VFIEGNVGQVINEVREEKLSTVLRQGITPPPYIHFGVAPCSGPAPYAVLPLLPSLTVDLCDWLDLFA